MAEAGASLPPQPALSPTLWSCRAGPAPKRKRDTCLSVCLHFNFRWQSWGLNIHRVFTRVHGTVTFDVHNDSGRWGLMPHFTDWASERSGSPRPHSKKEAELGLEVSFCAIGNCDTVPSN